MSLAGTLPYTAFSTSSSSVTLENRKVLTPTDDGVTLLYQLNMDATSQPQVSTVTINATMPVADCYYRVTIDDYTANAAQISTLFFATASALTAPDVAARLAALINAATPNRPDVSAVASTNTVVVTSMLAGTNGAFTVTVECLQASNGSAVSGSPITQATTTAASGTGRNRSVMLFTFEIGASTSTANSPAAPELQISGVWYNGAAVPVTQSTVPVTRLTGPLSFDALRAVT